MQEDVSLARFTTFGVGGPARWFVEAVSEDEIVEAVRWSRGQELPLLILGGGSNLLVADAGFNGLALKVGLLGISVEEADSSRVFRAAAGENWDGFVSRAVDAKCAGVECLAGIPGTVGGTPVQNVGAYGQEVAETIERVRVLELASLEFAELTSQECGFAYRSSIFNSTARGRFLVTRVDYRLKPNCAANLRYPDLKKALDAGAAPTLKQVAEAVRAIRRSKGMLLVEGDADCRSAGSFFKNPIIPHQEFVDLKKRLGTDVPHYPAGLGEGLEAFVKLPAAWLVEQAGFHKGFTHGNVGISSKHTLALTNRGGGTAAEMLVLRDLIVAGVRSVFGIALEMEPVLVGFEGRGP